MARPAQYGYEPSIAGVVAAPTTQLAVEYGQGPWHLTKIIFTGFAVGAAPSGASLGFGAKIYTWPVDYSVMVEDVSICGSLSSTASVKTDTPEVGIGTVVASGVIATLSGTFENLVDGGAAGGTIDADAVAPDVNGTVFQKASLTTARPVIQKTGGAARDLFLNLADAWAASANGNVTFTGDVMIRWRAIGDV